MAQMQDSVTGGACLHSIPVVGGYVDGLYGPNDPYGSGWSAAAWALYPNSQHVTITVEGAPGAKAADVENGAMNATQAAAWALSEIRAGRRPTIYAALWTWKNQIDQALAKVGLLRVRDVDGWVAATSIGTTIPAGFVALQYAQGVPGPYGHNIDLSVTNDVWPGFAPTPVPPAPPHPPNLLEDFTVNTKDDTTGGTWIVDPADGHIETANGAPYLGGLNEPVADKYHWKETGNITGITSFTDGSGLGYAIIVRHFTVLPSGNWYSMYTFPRSGAAINQQAEWKEMDPRV